MDHYEIERKFLIKYPDLEKLQALPGVDVVKISQTYLSNGPQGETRRVRTWTSGGETKYISTEKQKVSAIKRVEREWEISPEEYEEKLKERDKKRNPIEKTRYRIPYDKLLCEIDIYPFWKKQAFLEIEMPSEDYELRLPDYVSLIREVTEDGRYTNHALALKIPEEEV